MSPPQGGGNKAGLFIKVFLRHYTSYPLSPAGGVVGWALPTIFLPSPYEGVWSAEMGNKPPGNLISFPVPLILTAGPPWVTITGAGG